MRVMVSEYYLDALVCTEGLESRYECTVRNAGDGSAMLMPKMKSGIRACCRLVMKAARHS